MRLGEREISDIPAISTTSLSLDAAIGIGGVPRGRIIEIYGPESSGKSTLAMHIVAQAQLAGGVAAYIDAEHAMDADYAAKLGVKIDDMLISQPDSGEQALEIAEALVRSNGVDVIVVDSVAALVPRAELDGEMGDALPGLQARLMSQALRKLTCLYRPLCLVMGAEPPRRMSALGETNLLGWPSGLGPRAAASSGPTRSPTPGMLEMSLLLGSFLKSARIRRS